MNNKHKRVLWLLNHTTLREFEVPLLRALGYEVFTPKVFILNDFSGTVDYQFDESLTIPKAALAALNQHDFYYQSLTYNIRSILNDYFSFAIPGCFLHMIHELMKHFKGHTLIRAFGLLEGMSYTRLIQGQGQELPDFIKHMNAAKDRVWFAQSYTNLADSESPFFKARVIDLPLGLPESMLKNENQWIGGNHNILFVCPRIGDSYFRNVFEEFKRTFHDLPYIVAGGQPVPVPEAKVAGFQPRHVFDEWLKTCKVMFYHSRQPRHLHYHPLEAVSVGMPLVYMSGGILETLGGNHQPGACRTTAEAREKIKRILNDDKALVDDIRHSQKKLLETFSVEHCKKEWQKNFVDHFTNIKIANPVVAFPSQPKKIAVFLPESCHGGRLNSAKNFAKMLHMGSRQQGEQVNVVFSCIEGVYNIQDDFSDLISEGIQVRETNWQRLSIKEILGIPFLQNANYDVTSEFHQYPVDNIANFEDCDFWFILSDAMPEPVLAVKPYALVAYDYVQRYMPEDLRYTSSKNAFISNNRRAQFVIATTPQTRDDSIQYAGVRKENSCLLPMEFITQSSQCVTDQAVSFIKNHYFIWTTNDSVNKNHLKALDALELYYKSMRGEFSVLITDPSGLFADKPSKSINRAYWKLVREKINNSSFLKEHVHVAGYLKPEDYYPTLKQAKFIWHPALIDNGTFSVIDAAYHGVPALSSDYPQMHYINDRFRLNMRFCQANSAKNMAEQLKQMETQYEKMISTLPEKAYLDQFGCQQLAPAVWSTIRELI